MSTFYCRYINYIIALIPLLDHTKLVRFAKRWRNLNIIPFFHCSEHALESCCHYTTFPIYVIQQINNNNYFFTQICRTFRGVLLPYFNMKKPSSKSHGILVEVYDERVKSGVYELNVVILAWKKNNVLRGQKSLKMKN